jgi:membrane associated rhomboid family serine protease
MVMFRAIRALGFWGILTLLLVYILVGSVVSAPFHKNSLVAAIAGNVGGIVGAVAYLIFWRRRFNRRNFVKPS